jgi:hypothetical protein
MQKQMTEERHLNGLGHQRAHPPGDQVKFFRSSTIQTLRQGFVKKILWEILKVRIEALINERIMKNDETVRMARLA